MKSTIRIFLPFLGWLREYTLATFKTDALAGLTVSLVLIPQSMANAQLAGMPAYYGIYAALLPALVAGLWGSSRQMVSGTVAVISLMAAAALEPLAISGIEGYIAYSALLTLLVGIIQLTLGLCRMGIVVNFLSLPVISGFTNAASILIAISQLPKLFGVNIDTTGAQYTIIQKTIESAWNYTHLSSLLMAILAFATMSLVRHMAPRLPAVLMAVALTTGLSWLIHFDQKISVDVRQIQSHGVQTLFIDLNQQQEQLQKLAEEAAASADPSQTTLTPLERTFKQQERSLLRQRILQNMALEKEHLHRMLFVAQVQPDGTRIFFATRSPDLTAPADAPESLPVQDTTDGKTWRLQLGSGSITPHSLTLSAGGDVVGSMPAGLPSLAIPNFSWANLLLLLPQALIIAFVGFAESISIAKSAANKDGSRIDSNQELVGQGLANIVGGLCSTSPVAGSFSSSAVNISAGAKTGFACAFAALAALITLMFLTGAIAHLPQPVLAAVVMRAVANLVNLDEFRRVWLAQWHDGCIAAITFLATLFLAPHLDYGIAIGVVLSLASFFYRSMRPVITSLSCGQDSTLRDAQIFGLRECRHIAIVHFQGPLFFGNCGMLEDHIVGRIERQKDLRHIHLVCSGITHIDASGEESLDILVQRAAKAGINISFSGVVGSVADVFYRTGIIAMVGWENIFLTPREAVCALRSRVQHDADCTDCPLSRVFCRKEDPHEFTSQEDCECSSALSTADP